MVNFKAGSMAIAKRLCIATLIFCMGVYVGYRYFVPELKTELAEARTQIGALYQALEKEQQKPPQIKTETKTQTQIAYVPKETIIYKDAITGETVTGKEATDVQLDVKPPSINMKYNGRDYEISGIAGESSKFENGKLVGEISTASTIDVTDLVNKEVGYRLEAAEKHLSLGAYATNQGFVGSIGVINKGLEYKIIGKVPEIKEFYGAGIEFKF